MNGREENERRLDLKIKEKIKNKPQYVRSYYDTLHDKTYTTRDTYINYVINFIDYLEGYGFDTSDINCFKDIRPSLIDSYIANLDSGVSIKRSRLYGIKSFFCFLKKDRYVDFNPCDDVKPPRAEKEYQITALDKREIKTVEKNITYGCGNKVAKARQERFSNRDMAIIMMGLSLGLRVTSISEINCSDIDFEEQTIRVVVKGNKTRFIYFSDKLGNVIKDWLKDREVIVKENKIDTDALFISRKNVRITSSGIAKLVRKYTQNIDKHITPHKLRSTCATNVYNATGDIYLTAELLGHSNVSTTRRYAKIDEDRKKKAASAMDKILF